MTTAQACGCLTCGDAALPMRIVKLDQARGLALCEDDSGGRRTVEVTLVDDPAPGQVLLVHADVAIARAAPSRRTAPNSVS